MGLSSATRWSEVAARAAVQHGRVTTAQLLGAGLGSRAIARAVASGRLHREHVGVYAVGHRAPTAHGRWMSAVLACGDEAALTLRSGARLHRLPIGERAAVDVVSPTGRGRVRPGIRAVRAELPPEDRAVRDGIPVVAVHRLLVDLAHELDDEDEVIRLVREAQFRRLFDARATMRALALRPNRVLIDLLADDTGPGSWLEERFRRLLRRHGIAAGTEQPAIGGHRVDFAWPAQRVAVELDGGGAHRTPDAFQRDRSQSNVLQLAGWLVLRFTYADVTRRPAQTARRLQAALSRGSRRPA